MRLDKFLKVSGLIPRRTIAKEACEAGRVALNGEVAKPAALVRVGDRIVFDLGRGAVSVEVAEIPGGNVRREGRDRLYRIVSSESDQGGSGAARPGSEGSS